MNIFFIILIIFYILNIGIALGKHGEEKIAKYNFWTTLLGSGTGMTILYFAVKTGF